MTKAFDETRAERVARSEAIGKQIIGLQETINAFIADKGKIDTEIMTMDETRELLTGMGFAQSRVSATKETPSARRTPSPGRKPKETAVPKEKQKRPPAKRPVREFLTAHGPATGAEILAALQKLGIPEHSISNYFTRAMRLKELTHKFGRYHLPGQDIDVEESEESNGADEDTQTNSKPRKPEFETLKFIHNAGAMGVNEWQLNEVNAMDSAHRLLESGEIERFSDGDEFRFRVPTREDAAE